MWLYKATGDRAYLDNAIAKWEEFYFQYQDSPLNWESKRGGATVRLHPRRAMCFLFSKR